ncbi:Cocaine esterase [Capillimicrobium parvum]|uniref:Cocaine esterase n=2 Tax=Capillimicrobium parvum TaxID=2884022 RepID=A0A9E7C242_9ACTN|nr:Cocaine esterase [Capillimicrobium parvum]
MRDGCMLRANVFRPDGDGRHPVLVFRTPYDKNFAQITFMTMDSFRAVEAGYVVVQQDVRGRFASEGDVHAPFVDEFADGHDTVEWAARQPWSNGAVGVYGTSYHGFTAWAAAVEAPPALRTIAPSQAPNATHRVFWRGGAFQLGMHANWSVRVIGPNALLRAEAKSDPGERMAAFADLVEHMDDFATMASALPPRSLPAGRPDDPFLPYIYDVFEHRARGDDFHRQRSIEGRHAQIGVPALIIAGWHDPLLESDLAHFTAMRANAATPQAREHTRLVVGPWVHGAGLHMSAATEVDFGTRASGLAMDLREDLTTLHLRWFDRWLKGAPAEDEAPVRIFVMGRNRWQDETEWPPARAVATRWHLHSDAGLSPRAPDSGARARTYVHDPADPVPTIGGATLLPLDHRRGSASQADLLTRPDVLVFTSEVLDQALEVIGRVRAELWAATSARDADWVIKLCDVHPDGRTFNVCDGIVRASLRDSSWAAPRPIQPYEPVRYEIDLLSTAMVFDAGHRLCVLVMSSDFPRYDRNPGTGEWSLDADGLLVAAQQVFCDAQRPSFVELPTINRRR